MGSVRRQVNGSTVWDRRRRELLASDRVIVIAEDLLKLQA
jgi:hypothetical protein